MKNTVFVKLLVQLISVVVLINLLVGLLIYRYTNNILVDQAIQNNDELLKQTEKIVIQAMAEIEQLALSLGLNSNIQKSVMMPWNYNEDFSFLINTNRMFTERIISSKYIQSIYLYSCKNHRFISNLGVLDLQDFSSKQKVKKFIRGARSSLWEADQLSNGIDKTENVISYYSKVPIHGKNQLGVLLINLKEDVLYNAVINTNNKTLGDVAIIDNNGKVLSYKDKDLFMRKMSVIDLKEIERKDEGHLIQEINGVKTLVSFYRSTPNNWIYLTFNPYNEVIKGSNKLLSIIFKISVVCLSIGIALIYFISRNYYLPLKKIIKEITAKIFITNHDEKRNEFNFIQESLHKLYSENIKFRKRYEDSEMIRKEHFILTLLTGIKSDEKEIYKQLDHYQINLYSHNFIVLVLKINFNKNYQEKNLNLHRYKIRDIGEIFLNKHEKGIYVSHFQQKDVIILNTHSWNPSINRSKKVKEIAFRIREQINKHFPDIPITIGIGNEYKSIYNISNSYHEAQESLLYEKIAGEGSIISFMDIQVNHDNRLVYNEYQQLISMMENKLKLGDIHKTCKIKKEIFKKLKKDNLNGYLHKEMVLNQILNMLVKVKTELIGNTDSDRNLYFEYKNLHSIQEIQNWFHTLILDIDYKLKQKRKNKNLEVIHKITKYIDKHYREPISLQVLADLVYMNSHYISKLFKEITGKNFIDYLTEIRFKKACELLISTAKNINEIAQDVGFGHRQNLIRTFKKYTGMTPTEYRQSNIK